MTECNLYLKYFFKRIRQSSDSSLGFDIWWLDLFVKSIQDLCFARTRIWTCITKQDLMMWYFEKYLWFVFKVLLKNSYGEFRLNPTEIYSLQILSVDERGLRTFERVSLLEELFLKKICISKNSFSLILGRTLYL
jgi:hypothetical protein